MAGTEPGETGYDERTNGGVDSGRREFLKYSGMAAVGSAVSLAGYAGADEHDEDEDDEEGEEDEGLREFDEELPDDPTRDELLQYANGLSNALAPWVFLHQQFSIYGVNDDLDWEAREDEDINATEIETDQEEVTITQGTFATTLDPNGHNDTPTYNFLDQAYEPVLYRDDDGRVIANIATDFERVDETTIELEIEDDIVFHSGNEMTAEDVAFSINRTNDLDVSDQAGVVGEIEEARAEDDDVVVDLEIVEPAIFRNLAAFGRVMEEEWVEEREPGEIAEDINGTGPYELEEFVDDTRVAYERFDDYWGEEPEIERVVMNSAPEEGTRVDRLLTGESDLIVNVDPRDIPEIQDADGIRIEETPSIRSIFLVMNDVHEPFDSREFRQAMNFAVDVEAIIDSLLAGFGEPTSQPTLEGHFGHNPDVEPYGHDPERAEGLVEESGYADEEITIHTTTGRYLRDTDVAEAAASQIDDLENVTAEAEFRETGELFAETLDGDQETSPAIFLIGWGNPTFDANYTMQPWFDDPVFQHYTNEELTDLVQQSNEIVEEDEEDEMDNEEDEMDDDDEDEMGDDEDDDTQD